MLEITKETFEKHCPFGFDAQSDIFENVEGYFMLGWMDLADSLLGKPLADKIGEILESEDIVTLPERTEYIIPTTLKDIKVQMEEYVIKRAMYLAIPSLDLVLTSNGFGVVQTKDLAPAIPERVNRLRQQCYNDADAAFDMLIKSLPGNPKTRELLKEGNAWESLTEHLVWTAKDFQKVCKPDTTAPNRSALVAALPVITSIELKMRYAISHKQFEKFIALMRSGEATWTQTYAIQLLKAWMSAAFRAQDHIVLREDGILIAFMEEHPDEFNEYMFSTEYDTRHAESFQSSKKDGCFIFR